MSDVMLEGTYVTICDWRGRVTWISGSGVLLKPGDYAWQHMDNEHHEQAKTALSRVVTVNEVAKLEWHNRKGECFRSWLWPLHSPEAAVCVLSISIPKELALLTDREREMLGALARGRTIREIATELDVSTSTVHTHLRKAREKLSLPNLESLTGFAARYCHPHAAPTAPMG